MTDLASPIRQPDGSKTLASYIHINILPEKFLLSNELKRPLTSPMKKQGLFYHT